MLYAVLIAFCAEPPRGEAAADLATAMRRAGVALVEHARKKGWRNIGVLKPLVMRDGDRRLRDDVGNLNDLLRGHLHMSLLLQPVDDPIGVAADADSVAAKLRGATHLTAEGRRILFAAGYPLAWGDASVSLDAFVTVFAYVGGDPKSMTLDFCVIEPSGVTPIARRVVVPTTASLLGAMGESFATRGLNAGVVAGAAAGTAPEPAVDAKKPAAHPAVDPNAPFRLEVLYDRMAVPFERADDGMRIPEPEKQKVGFRIHRLAPAGRFGLVLKVNGENTLFRERQPDYCCTKWVSSPGDRPIEVDGFQSDDARAGEFRILARAESREMEVCYGDDAGLITLSVFRESTRTQASPVATDESVAIAAVDAAARPEKRPKNFDALLQAIYTPTTDRGLIGAGELKANAVRRVEFRAEREPAMCIAVRYYRP